MSIKIQVSRHKTSVSKDLKGVTIINDELSLDENYIISESCLNSENYAALAFCNFWAKPKVNK
jgi:hypothetical protein